MFYRSKGDKNMSTLKQLSKRDVKRIMKINEYKVVRTSGDHNIWRNTKGHIISIPVGEPNRMMMRRLIKENNLAI